MLKPLLLLLLSPLALAAPAPGSSVPEKVTVEQLNALLLSDQAKPDGEIARELSGIQLTERPSTAQFARLSAQLPGEKSHQELVVLADSAALLGPTDGNILADPRPDSAALRQMLVQVVGYVNTALRQLPNFIATRETTAFEDRPQEDIQEATDVVSLSYLPIHFVAKSSAEVTYRDGHEVADLGKKKHDSQSHGLATAGEFGPFLSTVLADAVKGKITWGRWERGIDGADAVFHYEVSADKSHYVVQFCCVAEFEQYGAIPRVFSEKTGYHGEITFIPSSGAILRITVEADLPPGDLIAQAGMVVEYGSVAIGEKSLILPTKSVSLLKAHTEQPRAGMHMALHTGAPKTFLNDTVFEQYHQFRGEVRILTGEAAEPAPPKSPKTQ